MKKKIAFICVHNSCRSQIAEALGKHFRGNEFEFYSAGTETKPQINQDAVRIMKELYGIDMDSPSIPLLISRFFACGSTPVSRLKSCGDFYPPIPPYP